MFGNERRENADFHNMGDNVDQARYNGATNEKTNGSWWQRWSTRRKVLVFGTIMLVVIAIAVGLGVGLTLGRGGGGGGDDDDNEGQGPLVPPNGTIPAEIWKPTVGTSWNYELLNAVNDTSADAEVWDIDLFNNDDQIINDLTGMGKKILCYFSAGSYENWREDKDSFKDDDLGRPLDGWEGERWLDTNSENVRKIMQTRMDLAVAKRCHGVEPDNVDAYDNENGLDLTEDDATDYVTFLADEAHARNLSLALKNAGAIVSRVIDIVEYSVQEQCIQYENCNQFTPFIAANKPVFHVEYPKGDDTNDNNLIATDNKDTICDDSSATGFSTIIKNLLLDNFIESCPQATGNSTRR